MKTFFISAPLFWGYKMVADPKDFESLEDIVATMKFSLRFELLELGLQLLVEELDKTILHIHDMAGQVVYVCSCKH